MADWKQITARIRRARTSKDPAGQLTNLYQKTRDAMVAFELAKYFETSGQNADASKWYLAAAERFRRADWKTKAKEAAQRLGGTLPVEAAGGVLEGMGEGTEGATAPSEPIAFPSVEFEPEQDVTVDQESAAPESSAEPGNDSSVVAEQSATPTQKADGAKRRRGRRGGRNRHKGEPESPVRAGRVAGGSPRAGEVRGAVAEEEILPPRVTHERAMPQLPVEPLGEAGAPGARGRYGDPGLSSRLTRLEMQFRRLLACPPAKLEEAQSAPAGPGVFLLTDSDLTTYYYVEACQTLRIAVGNLMRGGTGKRGMESLKPQLADHLGIPESRVTKYLADHCVVRWLQLDEGASHFAHFVTAVLRPVMNE